MSRTLTLRDAGQNFSSCIRAVEVGEEFVITRNGRAVARLAPVSNARVLTGQQKDALACLRDVVREGSVLNTGPLDRDALHGR